MTVPFSWFDWTDVQSTFQISLSTGSSGTLINGPSDDPAGPDSDAGPASVCIGSGADSAVVTFGPKKKIVRFWLVGQSQTGIEE